jgi:hypothetical protein
MIKQKLIAKTPSEHFMRAAEDELARFVRKELDFQRAERDERAAKLRLPLAQAKSSSVQNRERRKQ